MFGEVIGEIEVSQCPIHMEVVLVNAVAYPIEAHIDGAGASLGDRVVG